MAPSSGQLRKISQLLPTVAIVVCLSQCSKGFPPIRLLKADSSADGRSELEVRHVDPPAATTMATEIAEICCSAPCELDCVREGSAR